MTDVLGILKGTLTGGKVKNNDFKTKVETEITSLEGTAAAEPDADKKAIILKKVIVLQELLKGDTFTKIDLNADGEITEAELDRAAKIDGKPEFTIEDVRALKRRPPTKAGVDETKLDKIPVPLRLAMRPLSINDGGYLQPDFQLIAGDRPKETTILPPVEVTEEDPTDATKTITNNFTPFIGIDDNVYIPGFEGDYKDTSDTFEYIIPLKELQTFAAFNPKERVWIRTPGKYFNSATFAQDESKDIPNLPQIDVSTPEGRARLSEYIKKYLLLDSSGKLDFTKLQQFKGAKYHEGTGAKGLRESRPESTH